MNATRGAPRQRASEMTDDQIAAAYRKHESVYKAGRALGISHATVHRRLEKLGLIKPINVFTEADRDRLRRDYRAYRDRGDLALLAQEMGRTKPFICRQAGKLGITNQSVKKPWTGFWASMSETELRELFDEFKRSLLTPSKFCEQRGITNLGFWKAMTERWPDEWEYAVEAAWSEDSLYRIGRVFEFKTRDHLISQGYYATRSNRSSTPADVIAFRQGEILMVQCKTDRYSIPASEWNELYDIAQSTGARPLLAVQRDDGRPEYLLMLGHKNKVNHSRQNVLSFKPGDDLAA